MQRLYHRGSSKDWAPVSSRSALSERKVLWLGCEMFPIVQWSQVGALFGKVMGPLGAGALIEEALSLCTDLEV